MNEEAITDESHAGVKVPPPLTYLISILLGGGIEYLFPYPLFPHTSRFIVGALLIVSSIMLIIWAKRGFDRENTPLPPWKPTKSIVTLGPYRYSRNPMYIALTVFQAGLAILANSPWILAMLIPVLAIMRYTVIAKEERYLELKFGEGYLSYKKTVRRWV